MLGKKYFIPLVLASLCYVDFGYITELNAAVIVKNKITYYEVTGRTGREIAKGFRADKRKSGYLHLKSNRHPIAYVHIEFDVKNIMKRHSSHYCFIKDADIVINAHFLYPAWKNKKQASQNLQNTWKEFMEYVTWHENQHVELTSQYAKQYLRLLKNTKFPLLGDCNVMPKKTRKTIAKMIKKLKIKQKIFDRSEARPGGKSYKIQVKLLKAK